MDLGFEPGVYNHPVVVLSPMLSAGELTSFGGTSLVDKFPTETKARGRYLPIKPSAPHPDNKILLELCEAEDRLTKDSYVHISKVLRAKLKALRPYVSHRLRTPYLSDNSYRQLIRHAQYSVTDWAKVFGFFWALVIILSACYGTYWLVQHLVQLVPACWLWLQHAVTHMVATIKNWFGNMLGHAELI
ncbi:hypothetical protein H633G_01406 [Metarhizium anisopliae BRIP 53284]|nr:hypothetical protein H633G_01406 [Metarhizium anisopliae BRIP 53284]